MQKPCTTGCRASKNQNGDSMKFDIITIGSALLDIYLRSDEFKKIPSGDFEGGVALCEAYGGKVEVKDVEVTTGGGGTNNAVSYARKGFKVATIIEMGKDLVAATIKEELRREGVDLSFVVEEEDEETGLSSIMVSSDGGRAIAVYRGASKMLTETDIPWERLETEWLHISSLGGQVELLHELLRFAREKGIKVVANPGKSEIEALRDRGGVDVFKGVEVLLLNREEAQMLTKIEFDKEEVWREQNLVGPRIVVTTDGVDGGKVCVEGKSIFYKAEKVVVVEETGAGDAFGSGLVAGLMRGKDIETAIAWGKRQAARVVQFMGPKKGLMSLAELKGHD
jgi:ribokinase